MLYGCSQIFEKWLSGFGFGGINPNVPFLLGRRGNESPTGKRKIFITIFETHHIVSSSPAGNGCESCFLPAAVLRILTA
jgi:hypothetical protein